MYKILTVEKRNFLVLQLKNERDKKIAYRINAVLLSDEGWTSPQIARALFISEGAIRDYLETYREEERLSFNHKGSEPLLTKEESKMLSDHLESTLYVKIKAIQVYVMEAFQKVLSIPTLHLWLKKNNFSTAATSGL